MQTEQNQDASALIIITKNAFSHCLNSMWIHLFICEETLDKMVFDKKSEIEDWNKWISWKLIEKESDRIRLRKKVKGEEKRGGERKRGERKSGRKRDEEKRGKEEGKK